MPELRIGDRLVGDGHPTYVIAEACVNHNGDFAVALRLVDEAAAAGADAVKFQLHYPRHEMVAAALPGSSNFDKPLGDILEETHLTEDQHAELHGRCQERGVHYLCTAYCREAGDAIAALVPAFKTGSGEMTNLPLLRRLARHGKPLLVATGMATQEEVDRTVETLRDTGVPFAIFHCTSEYPPVYEDINLGVIPAYRERYGVVVGHSDHTPDVNTALGAVAVGARMIEKHFTLSRDQEGPDHKVSLEPAELRELVRGIRILERAGGSRKDVFDREREIRRWAHHSVVTLRPVAAGEELSEANVWVKRPGTGIPAAELDRVLGRRAAHDLEADALLAWEDVA